MKTKTIIFRFCFHFNRINIHSLREHLAAEMIEEERLKKHIIFEDSTTKSPRKRLGKLTVLSQHRPDVRDVVNTSILYLILSFTNVYCRSNMQVKATSIYHQTQILILNDTFVK